MIMTTQLRRLRLKYQISLDELADAAGFSNQYLSALERGKLCFSAEQQEKIAAAFIELIAKKSNALNMLDSELRASADTLLTPKEVENEL